MSEPLISIYINYIYIDLLGTFTVFLLHLPSQSAVLFPQLPNKIDFLWVLLLCPVVDDMMDLVSQPHTLLVLQLLAHLPGPEDFINVPMYKYFPFCFHYICN